MTISSEVNRAGPYPTNGVTTGFPYEFKIAKDTHIQVILTDALGADHILELGANYTVSGVGEEDGGAVNILPAPSAGQAVTLLINVPFTQETDLENQGAFFAEVIEQALDLLTSQTQQLKERLSRAVVIPPSADVAALDALFSKVLRLGDSADAIDTVAGIADDVAAVAGIAGDIASILAVSARIAQVDTVAANVSQVDTVAGIAAQVATVAANMAGVKDFGDVYQGAFAAAPVTRTSGNPLQDGDLYFDTTLNMLRAYGAGEWSFSVFNAAAYYTKTEIDATFGTMGRRNLFVSTAAPTGAVGVDGDIYFQIEGA